MPPRKEYFDEPLVKVDFRRARFPRICPVCGSPATTIVRMNIAKAEKIPLRPSLDYLSPRRQEIRQSEFKILAVQVCENHSDPYSGTDRYQSLCLVIDGLLLAFLLFSLLFIGDRLWRAQPIPSWTLLIIGFFGVAMLFSYVAFRPNALERAVKIVGFDPGMQHVLISFKLPEYRDSFMNENQMIAELVTWIVRSDD